MNRSFTIGAIYKNWSNKDGQPYLDKNQRPQCRVVITPEGTKDRISSFCYQDSPVLSWDQGQRVEVDVTEKGGYLNFSEPKQSSGPTTHSGPSDEGRNTVILIDIQKKVEALYKATFPE
jgi:hypothetical protein